MKIFRQTLKKTIRNFCQKDQQFVFNQDFFKNLAQTSIDKSEDIEIIEDGQIEKSDSQQKKQSPNLVRSQEAILQDNGIIQTELGDLKLPNYLQTKLKKKISNIYYLKNSFNTNFIIRVFKHDPKALFIFEPTNNFKSSRLMFEVIVKKIEKHFFDKIKSEDIKNFKLESMTSKECNKLFHDTNRKLLNIRNFMDRFLVIIDNEFTIKQEETPSLQNYIQQFLKDQNDINPFKIKDQQFKQYSILFPIAKVLKLNSLKQLEQKGVMYDFIFNFKDTDYVDRRREVLNAKIFAQKYEVNQEKIFNPNFDENSEFGEEQNKNLVSKFRIFNYYNVFPPTNKLLYKFVFNELKKDRILLQSKQNILDVGCGSGVLTMLYYKAGFSKDQNYYALDKNSNAVKNTQMNGCLNEIIVNGLTYDLLQFQGKFEFWNNKDFDFIICNPPWIFSKQISDFDNGNYDHKGKFMKKLFEFVNLKLNKKSGEFWLIFSKLPENCELIQHGFIEKQAEKYKLKIRNIAENPNEYYKSNIKNKLDLVKLHSSHLIYKMNFYQLIILTKFPYQKIYFVYLKLYSMIFFKGNITTKTITYNNIPSTFNFFNNLLLNILCSFLVL